MFRELGLHHHRQFASFGNEDILDGLFVRICHLHGLEAYTDRYSFFLYPQWVEVLL
jgi:hypothetical protein